MFRQGDVSLHEISKLPNGIKRAKDNILAYGELSNHRHWLDSKQICVFEDKDKNKFVELKQDTELVHSDNSLQPVYDQETAQKQDKHIAITITKGIYAVKQEGKDVFEYSVFGSPNKKIGNFVQIKLEVF